jgi:hypothetical protein
MKHQEMNLNIRYDSNEETSSKISLVYEQLNGWLGFGQGGNQGEKGIPYWHGFDENEKNIYASLEPSGLHFTGLMEDDEWKIWKQQIKDIGTKVLGYKVGEIELGEVDD